MNNLANVLNYHDQAEELHRQSLRLKETVLGKGYPYKLISTSNLAEVLSDHGKYEQAEEMSLTDNYVFLPFLHLFFGTSSRTSSFVQ